MRNITRIPSQRVPIIEKNTGLVTREWFRFLNNLYVLTGGGTSDITISDFEVTPSESPSLLSDFANINAEIDGLKVSPSRPEPNPLNYGQFFDTTTQTAAAINTAYAVTFNSSGSQYGVYVDSGNTSHIKVTRPAVYNVQFSLQLDKTAGGTGLFWTWYRVNGVDVPNSASQVRIQGNNAEVFVAANIFVAMSNGDYLQLMWAADDTSVQLLAEAAAAPHPGIPSVIITVTQVNL